MTISFSCCNCLLNYVLGQHNEILVFVALSRAARIHNLWISMKTRTSSLYCMCQYGRKLNSFYAYAISTKIAYADPLVSSHWRSSHYAVRHVRNRNQPTRVAPRSGATRELVALRLERGSVLFYSIPIFKYE